MPITLNTYETASQAMEGLERKGVLPTALSSRELRDQVAQSIRDRAVWSARSTNAEYVQGIRKVVGKYLAGEMNLSTARAELKLLLARLGYSPRKGFPGDAKLGIPSAEPGSLRDLSSDKRIGLVLKTQISLHQNAALKARGMEEGRLYRRPAWELVRVESRRVPRGSDKSAGIGWQRRWLEAGGPILKSGRLVALKTDPVWEALGDSSKFDDALDVSFPPFAFNSGMGWRDVARDEAEALLGKSEILKAEKLKPEEAPNVLPPPPVKSTRGMDDPVLAALRKAAKAELAEKPGYIRMQEIVKREFEESRRAYENR